MKKLLLAALFTLSLGGLAMAGTTTPAQTGKGKPGMHKKHHHHKRHHHHGPKKHA